MAVAAEQLTVEAEVRRNIPANVRTLMVHYGVSRPVIMASAHMSKPTLSERLSGKSPFKDYELLAIVRLFNEARRGRGDDGTDITVDLLYKDPKSLISSRCYLEIVPPAPGQQHLPGIIPPVRDHLAVAV